MNCCTFYPTIFSVNAQVFVDIVRAGGCGPGSSTSRVLCVPSYITYVKLLSSVGYIILRVAHVMSPLGKVELYYAPHK